MSNAGGRPMTNYTREELVQWLRDWRAGRPTHGFLVDVLSASADMLERDGERWEKAAKVLSGAQGAREPKDPASARAVMQRHGIPEPSEDRQARTLADNLDALVPGKEPTND